MVGSRSGRSLDPEQDSFGRSSRRQSAPALFADSPTGRRLNRHTIPEYTEVIDSQANVLPGKIVMPTVTLEEAQIHLAQLIEQIQPGDDILITRDQKLVARLVAEPEQQQQPRRPGTLKGTVLYMAPDFDAPLEDFKEYME